MAADENATPQRHAHDDFANIPLQRAPRHSEGSQANGSGCPSRHTKDEESPCPYQSELAPLDP